MQTVIIASKDKKKREEYASKLCKEAGIHALDTTTVEPEEILTSAKTKQEGSIGIKAVRLLQETLTYKPVYGAKKAVIFKNAEALTLQAQNALLKTLEEPPAHTIILVTVANLEVLIPTVCSRCTIIELDSEIQSQNTEQEKEYREILAALPNLAIGERLKIAQDQAKTKETALLWLEQMIISSRSLMLESIQGTHTIISVPQITRLIRALEHTHKDIKTTNISPRFSLEILLLSI